MLTIAITCSLLVLVSLVIGPTKASNVIEINERNWPLLLRKEWIVSICAKGHGDCKKMELNSHQLIASRAYSNWNVGIAVVDLAKESGLLLRLSVLQLPCVYHVIGGDFRRIDASLNVKSLCRLVESGDWITIEVVPWWQHPTSHWINLTVFAHKAAVNLWDSGVVSDYNVATWCIALMLTGIFRMIVWVFYGGWRGLMFLWIYWKRLEVEDVKIKHKQRTKQATSKFRQTRFFNIND